MKKNIAIHQTVTRFDGGERMPLDKVEIGQWFWVRDEVTWDGQWVGKKKGDTVEWFGCAMEIGSNYIEVQSPRSSSGSYSEDRIHFDEFEERLRFEPNAEQVIAERIESYRVRVNALLDEVRDVTQRLGVVPTERLADQSSSGTNALIAVSGKPDTKAYKNALILAKDKTLPDLFKAIEEANSQLARWMIAPTMSLQATVGPMKESIKVVEDRIYTLELYAGLAEDALQVREGDPAAREEKLRVMQRRLYMDEECLVNYEAGGMELKDVGAFDAWLSRPDNFGRILPFDRCVVSFRVRREDKERWDGGTLWRAWVNVQLQQADKITFLYVRNGEQLWRVNCDFDFSEKIVPDQSEFDPSQPMMVKMFASRVDKIIPLSAWEVLRDKELEQRRLAEEWKATNPKENWFHNPHSWGHHEHTEYHPFDPSSVYYDEATEAVSKKIKKYNRVAVILQGLFDRSLVLHPHNPVRVWDPVSFAQAVELIYDATTLTYGDKPDFEAFRARLNASIDVGSIVTGQEEHWMRMEAIKENKRQSNDYRNRDRSLSNYHRFKPYGNPGPGLVGAVPEWKPRSRKAVFRWERERAIYRFRGDSDIPTSIEVPASKLLNISAYKPGDYKQFFGDPRTREEYLVWAPLLLAAEDYHAGKVRGKKAD